MSMTATRAEEIEARCRKAMAQVTKARGFDSQRDRDDDIAWIDALLDEWNDHASRS